MDYFRTRRPSSVQLFVLAVCCCTVVSAPQSRADLTVDAACLRHPPNGVHIGQGVDTVQAGDRAALRFHNDAIVVPLDTALSATSGTVKARFQLPQQWPSKTRDTLFHVGEQAHVHVTLFTTGGRLIAVYKGGEEYYAAISFAQSAQWQAGSLHDVMFCWQTNGQSVDFYLEADDRLVGSQTGHLIAQWPGQGYVGARRRGQVWQGAIERVSLSPKFTFPRELSPGRRAVVVDGDSDKGTCYNF